jgi:hypothetical protein
MTNFGIRVRTDSTGCWDDQSHRESRGCVAVTCMVLDSVTPNHVTPSLNIPQSVVYEPGVEGAVIVNVNMYV